MTAVVDAWAETVEVVVDGVVPAAPTLWDESRVKIFFLDHAQSSSAALPISQRRIFDTCGSINFQFQRILIG